MKSSMKISLLLVLMVSFVIFGCKKAAKPVVEEPIAAEEIAPVEVEATTDTVTAEAAPVEVAE